MVTRGILENPGKITLVAIGPCTNIAKALQKYPSIASQAKEIIYMGGAVKCIGNVTPYAEYNFIYDPEAAAICLRAPFRRQTLVSLDVCNTVQIDSATYFDIYNAIKNQKLKKIFEDHYFHKNFTETPQTRKLIWDVIASAITIDPDILLRYEQPKLDVDDDPESPTYGKSFISTNKDRQTVRMVTKVDDYRIFDIVKKTISKIR